MIKSIGTTAVAVSNAAKAMEWYREKLRFDVQGDPKTHWVVEGVQGLESRLHLCQSISLEKGNTGIAFLCDDVQRTYESRIIDYYSR